MIVWKGNTDIGKTVLRSGDLRVLNPLNDVVFIFHADGLVIGSITLLFRAATLYLLICHLIYLL